MVHILLFKTIKYSNHASIYWSFVHFQNPQMCDLNVNKCSPFIATEHPILNPSRIAVKMYLIIFLSLRIQLSPIRDFKSQPADGRWLYIHRLHFLCQFLNCDASQNGLTKNTATKLGFPSLWFPLGLTQFFPRQERQHCSWHTITEMELLSPQLSMHRRSRRPVGMTQGCLPGNLLRQMDKKNNWVMVWCQTNGCWRLEGNWCQ